MKYIITCLFIGLSLSINAQQARETKDTKTTPDTTLIKKSREIPKVKEKEKLVVISRMKNYKEVQEALVVQQDQIKKVSLALIVKQGTSKKRAMQLGDHFLKHAMSHFEAESKSEEKIGKSLYNYMVSVCTDRDVIIMGTKILEAETITW